jgi:MFS family permease
MLTITDPVASWLVRLRPLPRILFVLFGAVLIHLSLGTYHTFGNMLPYLASYLRNHTDPEVKIEHLMWIPTFQGCFPFAMIIGGFLSMKLGPRLAAAIGCYTMALGVFLSYFTIKMSYGLFLVTYGFMFGLGQGIAYVVAVASVINWAPDKIGLVSGIVAAGFGLSSSIFAPIQTRMINPENKAASTDGYFMDEYLINRVPDTFKTLSLVYFIMQTIGLIFICDPPAEFVRKHFSDTAIMDMAWLSKRRTRWQNSNNAGTSKRDKIFSGYSYSQLSVNVDDDDDDDSPKRATAKRKLSINDDDTTGLITCSADIEADESDDDLHTIKPQPISLRPSEVLKSSTFYWLFIALFCCSFYGNLFYNLYKTFGETFIEDDMFLAIAFSIGTIANAAARIGWGLLTDKTSFQVALSSASCLATALLLTMPLTAALGKYMYLLWLIMMFICLAATHALFITAAVRCFGTQYKATNYGCLILSTTLSGILLSISTSSLLSIIGYNWAFIISAAFPFTAFVITSAIRVTPQGHLII